MRRTRPGVGNRYHHERGSWSSRDASHYDQADKQYKPITFAPPPRVVHPVVKAPEHKCYRVIRLFLLDGRLDIEDIGYGDARHAIALCTSEEWRAQVLEPNGRVHIDNLRTLEERRS